LGKAQCVVRETSSATSESSFLAGLRKAERCATGICFSHIACLHCFPSRKQHDTRESRLFAPKSEQKPVIIAASQDPIIGKSVQIPLAVYVRSFMFFRTIVAFRRGFFSISLRQDLSSQSGPFTTSALSLAASPYDFTPHRRHRQPKRIAGLGQRGVLHAKRGRRSHELVEKVCPGHSFALTRHWKSFEDCRI
jgi:hypothetical protein